MQKRKLNSSRTLQWNIFFSITLGAIMLLGQTSHAASKPKSPPTPPINPAIVYVIPTANGNNIGIANADGTNQKVVLSNGANNQSPSWSPDGTQIVFAGNLPAGPGIYRLAIDRNTGQAVGAPQLITSLNSAFLGIANPVWSPEPTPDGTYKIAYSDTLPGGNDYSIYLTDVPPATATPFKLTSPPAGISDLKPTWSPDATHIAVSHGRDNSASPPYDIQTLTLGTTGCPPGQSLCEISARQSLVRDFLGSALQIADSILNPAWGNTGVEIAVSAHIPPDGNSDIWIIPVDDPEAAWNLTETNKDNPPDRHETLPTWSPNDTQIAYRALGNLCSTKSFQGIVLRNVDGSLLGACEEKNLISGANSPNWWRGQ